MLNGTLKEPQNEELSRVERQLLTKLRGTYGHNVHVVKGGRRTTLPPKGRYVYLLSCDGELVVAGQGDKNRAQVVLDATGGRATVGHVKSLFVRLVRKYRRGQRFLALWIGPLALDEAKRVEKDIHKRFGGNALTLPSDVRAALDDDLTSFSESAALLVRLATLSFYSGLSDLRRWTRAGLVRDEDALAINDLLGGSICLPTPKKLVARITLRRTKVRK